MKEEFKVIANSIQKNKSILDVPNYKILNNLVNIN